MIRTARYAITLTHRDYEILVMAYLYDGVSIAQLKKRFWPNATSDNAYYPRIRALVKAGYLQVQRIPVNKQNGTWFQYMTIGARARDIVSDLLKVPLQDIKNNTKQRSAFTTPHRVAIGDMRLSLELCLEKLKLIEQYAWYTDREMLANSLQVEVPLSVAKLVITPDGMFTIKQHQWALTAFVEVDLGTITHLPSLRQRFKAYLLHSRTLKTPRPVLWVTSSKNRSHRLSRIAQEEAEALAADATIFLFTSLELVSEDTILTAPIWSVVNGPQSFALWPEHQEGAESHPQSYGYIWKQ